MVTFGEKKEGSGAYMDAWVASDKCQISVIFHIKI